MELRASYAHVWANCQGSTKLKQEPDPPNPVTDEGTLLHELVNSDLKNPQGGVGPLVVTDEHRNLAQGAIDFVDSLGLVESIREEKTPSSYLPEGLGGTPDLIGRDNNGIIHVIDYKFGYGAVEAVDNWQLLIYAVGAYGRWKITRSFKLHIYQPRDYVNGPVKTWELSLDEFLKRKKSLETIARNLRYETKFYANTGPHCRYCKSRIHCPVFIGSISHVLETAPVDSESANLSLKHLGAELKYLIQTEALVKSARSAFEEKISSVIEGGKIVPGWVMGSTRGKRYWSASIDDIKSAAGLLGVTLTKETPISITDASNNKTIRPILDSLTSKSAGSRKLVPFEGSKAKEIFKNE